MPRYQYTGPEAVLHGLGHAVNAVLHREDHGQPDGSTVIARPGDEITTTEPYEHAHMHLVVDEDTAHDGDRPVDGHDEPQE